MQRTMKETSATSSKKPNLRFLVKDDLYNFDYCVAAGGTMAKAAELFELPDVDTSSVNETTAGAVAGKDGYPAALIWFPSRKVHYTVLAHECVHAVLFMFQERGITPPAHNNDEHFTYYHGWLMDQLAKKLEIVCTGEP